LSAHAGGYRRRKRDATEGPIVKALKGAGRQWVDLTGAAVDDPGCPDGIAVWPGGFCFLELKAGKGQLSPVQRAWHAAYRGPPGSLAVARTELEALRATGVRC
jgi:hypothetical protein